MSNQNPIQILHPQNTKHNENSSQPANSTEETKETLTQFQEPRQQGVRALFHQIIVIPEQTEQFQTSINKTVYQQSKPLSPDKPAIICKKTEVKPPKNIKIQFSNKLQTRSRQKQQNSLKRRSIIQMNPRQRQEQKEINRRHKQAEIQFKKQQQKQTPSRKIKQVSQPCLKRSQSLQSSSCNRSQKRTPNYLDGQIEFSQKEKQKQTCRLKPFQYTKQQQQSVHEEELRAHQRVYIQRIKEKLNINIQQAEAKMGRRTKSQVSLYPKNSDQLKKLQPHKIIRGTNTDNSTMIHKINSQKHSQISTKAKKFKQYQANQIISERLLNEAKIYQQLNSLDMFSRTLKFKCKKSSIEGERDIKKLIKSSELKHLLQNEFDDQYLNQFLLMKPLSNIVLKEQTKLYQDDLSRAQENINTYAKSLKQKLSILKR